MMFAYGCYHTNEIIPEITPFAIYWYDLPYDSKWIPTSFY